jgi:hypothetical protein
MLVMGNPPARGGGGIPQRIMISSRSAPALQTTGAGQSGKTPGRRLQVADVPIHHPEQLRDKD